MVVPIPDEDRSPNRRTLSNRENTGCTSQRDRRHADVMLRPSVDRQGHNGSHRSASRQCGGEHAADRARPQKDRSEKWLEEEDHDRRAERQTAVQAYRQNALTVPGSSGYQTEQMPMNNPAAAIAGIRTHDFIAWLAGRARHYVG